MTIYRIPVDSTSTSLVQETTLDGTTYRLVFRHNGRDDYWYLTVRDLDDNEIAPSRRLVPGSRLLRLVEDLEAGPPGAVIVYGGTPSTETWDPAAKVIYLDEETVAEITA